MGSHPPTVGARGARELVTAATIGEQLRLAREEQRIPLREVSDQTRISIHYLEAIEVNDFQRLPGGIFNRSFVKAYAKYVGVDEKEAVEGYARYMRESGEPGEEVASSRHSIVYTDTHATRSPILTVVLAIVILAILTAAALAILNWYQRRSTELLQETVAPQEFMTGNYARPGSISPASGGLDIWKTGYEQALQ
jgi:cytoskeletal protein RodZ